MTRIRLASSDGSSQRTKPKRASTGAVGGEHRNSPDARPIFIASPARSGSTLLRYLLRAHPNVYCPAESNYAVACSTLLYTYSVASGDPLDIDRWRQRAIAACRSLADSTLGYYAAERGRSRWCDKSLVNLEHAELMFEIYPESQFILLERDCTDVIASALEACPWGISGFGFDNYIRDTPNNSVVALARYWVDKADQCLAIEDQHPGQTIRITYESLANHTLEVMEKLCAFLDLEFSAAWFSDSRVFDQAVERGPRDIKIAYSSGIVTDSIGRGGTIPIGTLIPPPLLSRIDSLRTQLGYSAVQTEQGKEVLPEQESSRLKSVIRHYRTFLSSYDDRYFRQLMGARDTPFTFELNLLSEGECARARIVEGRMVDQTNGDRQSHCPVVMIQGEILAGLMAGEIRPEAVAQARLLQISMPDGEAPEPHISESIERVFLRTASRINGSRRNSCATAQTGHEQEEV
jgi:hypothetical protein